VRATRLERALNDPSGVYCRFAPATDEPWRDGDPGVLRWSATEGAHFEVFEPGPGWPHGVGGDPFTVHAVTAHGDFITLPGSWPAAQSLPRSRIGLRASTVLLGAHSLPEDRWARLSFTTAHLHEWLPETGIEHGETKDDEHGMKSIAVSWRRPRVRAISLPTATLKISPGIETAWSYSPEFSITTSLRFIVIPNRKRTLEDLEERYLRPLLALVTFAADRPDAARHELLGDSDGVANVFHAGDAVEPRDWRPDDRFLFQAFDLGDEGKAIQRWFRLWPRIGHAIATFVDSVNLGTVFTPARLLATVTALEAYHRGRIGSGGSLEQKLKNLRDRGGIDPGVTGITNRALRLMVASRHWSAHLTLIGDVISKEAIDEEFVQTTRRAAALMQACLLRDIGVPKKRRQELFEKHYRAWPLHGT